MMQAATAAQGLLLPMSLPGLAVQSTRACSGLGAGVSGCSNPPQRSRTTIGGRLSSSAAVATTGLPWDQAWSRSGRIQKRSVVVRAAIQEQEQEQSKEKVEAEVEETTKKKGLEAGLWQIFTAKEKGSNIVSKGGQAKDLLTRYGGAYLATSISLSLVSFGLCYVLVSSGINVVSLLELVGVHTNDTGEKVGTFALAYAAHKAASPIRFPPTVALTPIVAGLFRKKGGEEKKP